MKSLAIIFLILCSASTQAASNVLLIIADDFGVDASALYNTSPSASVAPTPNLANLAANGVRFTNAYAYPTCSPTRSAILTGRYGFRTGTGDVISAAAANSLQAAEFTLPDAFAANGALGYQLKHFGKWHLTSGAGQAVNMSPSTVGGWPAFSGYMSGALNSYTSWPKVTTNGTPAGTSTVTTTTYATTDIVNDATSWIQAQNAASKPWFAWVAFSAPHTPFHLPSPTTLCPHYTNLSGTTQDINANQRSYYNAAVEAMDTEIGRLLATVDFSNTTVIFLGDNGTPAQVVQTPVPSGHGKDTLYEGGIHVPMIIRSPNGVAPGRTSDVLTSVSDLYPTILEAAGITPATTVPSSVTLDGQSLLPVLLNQGFTRTRLYAEQFDASQPTTGGRTLRDDRYKIIRYNTGTDSFYDLQADPSETTNLLTGGINTMTATQQSYYYRLKFEIARYSAATAPEISQMTLTGNQFSLTLPKHAALPQTLWRCTDLTNGFWSPVPTATDSLNGSNLTLIDPAPPGTRAFYSVVADNL